MVDRLDEEWLQLTASSGEVVEVRKVAHPRSRRLRLTVTAGGARLSCPPGTRAVHARAFLLAHVDWLVAKLHELKLPAQALPTLQVGESTEVLLRGQRLPLQWQVGGFPRLDLLADRLVLSMPAGHAQPLRVARGLLAGFFENQIRRDVAHGLGHYTARLGRAPTGLRIRLLKSLWGSLDTRDRVNLDLSLAMAQPEALRYVLVHELCHLKVRNHSPRFWAEVEQLFPEWREQRRWLRQHGTLLKAEMERLVVAGGV